MKLQVIMANFSNSRQRSTKLAFIPNRHFELPQAHEGFVVDFLKSWPTSGLHFFCEFSVTLFMASPFFVNSAFTSGERINIFAGSLSSSQTRNIMSHDMYVISKHVESVSNFVSCFFVFRICLFLAKIRCCFTSF